MAFGRSMNFCSSKGKVATTADMVFYAPRRTLRRAHTQKLEPHTMTKFTGLVTAGIIAAAMTAGAFAATPTTATPATTATATTATTPAAASPAAKTVQTPATTKVATSHASPSKQRVEAVQTALNSNGEKVAID